MTAFVLVTLFSCSVWHSIACSLLFKPKFKVHMASPSGCRQGLPLVQRFLLPMAARALTTYASAKPGTASRTFWPTAFQLSLRLSVGMKHTAPLAAGNCHGCVESCQRPFLHPAYAEAG